MTDIPVWVIVYYESGEQMTVIRCENQNRADLVIFHNHYYGRGCLTVRVKVLR